MPAARLTAITLGVADMRTSIGFYGRLGFERRLRATGEEVAFFTTGASVLSLYPLHKLAAEAGMSVEPQPTAYRGVTLAWNCASPSEVDHALAQAIAAGASVIKPAQATDYGGYAGHFADPDGHVWEVVASPGLVVAADGCLQVPE